MAQSSSILVRDATDYSCVWYYDEIEGFWDASSLPLAKARFCFRAIFTLGGIALLVAYIVQYRRLERFRAMAPWYLFGPALSFWILYWMFDLISSVLYGCYPYSSGTSGLGLEITASWFYGFFTCFLLAMTLFPVPMQLHRMVNSDSFRKVRCVHVFLLVLVCVIAFTAQTYLTWMDLNRPRIPEDPRYFDDEEEARRIRVEEQLSASLAVLQTIATIAAGASMLWAWWKGRKLGGRCTFVFVCAITFTASLTVDFLDTFVDCLYNIYPHLIPFSTMSHWEVTSFAVDTVASFAEIVAFISILVLASSRGMQSGHFNDKLYYDEQHLGDYSTQTAHGDAETEPAPGIESTVYDPVNPGRGYKSPQPVPTSPGPYDHADSRCPELPQLGNMRRQSGLQRYYRLPSA